MTGTGLAGPRMRSSIKPCAARCMTPLKAHAHACGVTAILKASGGMDCEVDSSLTKAAKSFNATCLFGSTIDDTSEMQSLLGNRTAGARGRTRPPACPAAAALPGPAPAPDQAPAPAPARPARLARRLRARLPRRLRRRPVCCATRPASPGARASSQPPHPRPGSRLASCRGCARLQACLTMHTSTLHTTTRVMEAPTTTQGTTSHTSRHAQERCCHNQPLLHTSGRAGCTICSRQHARRWAAGSPLVILPVPLRLARAAVPRRIPVPPLTVPLRVPVPVPPPVPVPVAVAVAVAVPVPVPVALARVAAGPVALAAAAPAPAHRGRALLRAGAPAYPPQVVCYFFATSVQICYICGGRRRGLAPTQA